MTIYRIFNHGHRPGTVAAGPNHQPRGGHSWARISSFVFVSFCPVTCLFISKARRLPSRAVPDKVGGWIPPFAFAFRAPQVGLVRGPGTPPGVVS